MANRTYIGGYNIFMFVHTKKEKQKTIKSGMNKMHDGKKL